MEDARIRHVSDTAYLVAHHRAVESARADAIFSDPLATRLSGDRGKAIAESMVTRAMTGWMVAMRTRLIDEYISLAIARGVDTVVNLGAGLDTRPYRMRLPATLTWVEVDHPDVIAFKEQNLRGEVAACKVERAGLDLSRRPPRRQLLAQVAARASRLLILTEGVVPYLDVAAVGALADDLRGLDHLDGWIVDYVSPESIKYRKRTGVDRQMKEAPFKFEPPDWFAFFAEHGFRCREMRYLADEGLRHGRPPPFPFMARLLRTLLWPFTPPAKRQGFRTFAGYALLEPAPR
jgi:methyltransferase (TIGR00027 family)